MGRSYTTAAVLEARGPETGAPEEARGLALSFEKENPMKIKLLIVLMVLALTLTLQPAPTEAVVIGPSPLQCAQFCATALCIQGYTCGLYTDPSGQLRCGCHL